MLYHLTYLPNVSTYLIKCYEALLYLSWTTNNASNISLLLLGLPYGLLLLWDLTQQLALLIDVIRLAKLIPYS